MTVLNGRSKPTHKPLQKTLKDMSNKYSPELGQLIFGQPFKELEVPEWLEAFLWYIQKEWERVSWNVNQKDLTDPWSNTGGEYKNKTFHVQAYSWNEEENQKYNFKWKDFEVSWYKYCGRGMSTNRNITTKEAIQMLTECLKSLRKEDKVL